MCPLGARLPRMRVNCVRKASGSRSTMLGLALEPGVPETPPPLEHGTSSCASAALAVEAREHGTHVRASANATWPTRSPPTPEIQHARGAALLPTRPNATPGRESRPPRLHRRVRRRYGSGGRQDHGRLLNITHNTQRRRNPRFRATSSSRAAASPARASSGPLSSAATSRRSSSTLRATAGSATSSRCGAPRRTRRSRTSSRCRR